MSLLSSKCQSSFSIFLKPWTSLFTFFSPIHYIAVMKYCTFSNSLKLQIYQHMYHLRNKQGFWNLQSCDRWHPWRANIIGCMKYLLRKPACTWYKHAVRYFLFMFWHQIVIVQPLVYSCLRRLIQHRNGGAELTFYNHLQFRIIIFQFRVTMQAKSETTTKWNNYENEIQTNLIILRRET